MSLKQHFDELISNKIGLGILIFGVLAFLFVIFLVYQQLFGSSYTGGSSNVEVSQEELDSFKQSALTEESVQEEREEAAPVFKAQKSISDKQITGAWDARLNSARALLQIQGGRYQIVIIPDNSASARLYSKGTYTLEDGLLLLVPNLEWGPPQSNRYLYRVLTRADIPVSVSKHRGKLVWQVPGPEVDVYVPNRHPILSETKHKIAVWSALK